MPSLGLQTLGLWKHLTEEISEHCKAEDRQARGVHTTLRKSSATLILQQIEQQNVCSELKDLGTQKRPTKVISRLTCISGPAFVAFLTL